MVDWWSALGFLEQVMVMVAVPATLVLIIQTIIIVFSSFGGNADSDVGDVDDIDTSDMSADGLEIFTVKGIVTFFSIFGWSGLLFLRIGLNQILSVIIAFVLGVIFMLLIAVAFKAMMKLQESGNLDIKTAVGISGTVYITIPACGEGMGKVSAVVSGRYSEFDAVTDEEEKITTGMPVVITEVGSDNVLVVVKK